MTKIRTAVLALLAVALVTLSLCFSVFSSAIEKAEFKIEESKRVFQSSELARKDLLEREWESKKQFLESPGESPEVLNAWLKKFIQYAQTTGLKMDKLEPVGGQEQKDIKEISVFLSFQASMPRFNEFIYHLLREDPLARVQSAFVRQDENSKTLSFELVLAKALS